MSKDQGGTSSGQPYLRWLTIWYPSKRGAACGIYIGTAAKCAAMIVLRVGYLEISPVKGKTL